MDDDLGQWRVLDEVLVLVIHQNSLGSRVLQDVVDLWGSETGVDGANDGVAGRDSKVCLQHGRNVGSNHCNTVSASDAELFLESVGKGHRPAVELLVSVASVSVDDSNFVGIDSCASGQEVDGVQLGSVGSCIRGLDAV